MSAYKQRVIAIVDYVVTKIEQYHIAYYKDM